MSKRSQAYLVFVGAMSVVGLDIYLTSIGW